MPPTLVTSQPLADRPARPTLPEIYALHADFVWRNLRRMGVLPASMDDAVQDVFLVVHRRLDDFAARSELKTWLFGIVLRVARTYRRSLRRRWAHLFDAPTQMLEAVPGSDAESPLELVTRKEASALLHKLLAELDADKRAMLVSVELEQMSVPEAALALGINLNTAYSRLRGARQMFDKAVERHRGRSLEKTGGRNGND